VTPPVVIEAGDCHIVIRCPRCGERADTFAHLSAKLTVTDDATLLRATLKAKPLEHRCGQLRIEDPSPDGVDTLPLDYAELAAGEGVRHV
jgi:hypothetical protein